MEDHESKKYHIKSHLIDAINFIEKGAKKEGTYSITGLKSGFDDLDFLTLGLQPSSLIVVAGRPGIGKTIFTMNIAEHVAIKMEKPCILFTLETSPTLLTTRFISSLSNVNNKQLQNCQLDEKDWDKVTKATIQLSESPLYIRDVLGDNIDDLCKKTHLMAKDIGDIGLIVIDYLQLLCLSGFSPENRTAELSAITRRLKILAKELNVPIILVSQLNRNVENRADKRPQMNDLRDSGSIEDDADLICLMHRDPYYKDSENISSILNVTEINIIKHRGGSTGRFLLTLSEERNRFSEFLYEDISAGKNKGMENSSEAFDKIFDAIYNKSSSTKKVDQPTD